MNTKATFLCDRYYHIYNRTHGQVKLFTEERNYNYFLKQYQKYLGPFLHIHAYALLTNHFHFSVAVKSYEEIENYTQNCETEFLTKGISKFIENKNNPEAIHDLIISQHQRIFISYSKALNKATGRLGGVFQRPFKHSHFDPAVKFKYMQYYLHHNARKHGLVKQFDEYPYTSYHDIMTGNDWLVNIEEVMLRFGSISAFTDFHTGTHYTDKFEDLVIEE